MATTNGFFDNITRRTSEVAAQTWDRAQSALGGLRAGAKVATDYAKNFVNPGAAAAGEEAGAKAAVQSAQRAAATGMEPGPSGLRSSAAAEAARIADPVGRTGPTGAQMLKTASEYTPKGLSGFAAKLGRAAPALAPVAEGVGAASNIAAGESPLKSIGRASLRSGATMLGGVLGAGAGTLVAPGPGTLAGGLSGGYGGYKIGDAVATSLFGAEPDGMNLNKAVSPAQAAAAPAAPRNAENVMVGRSSATDGDSLNGQRIPIAGEAADARPQAVLDSTSLNPASGYGVIKRTTLGNEGEAIAVGGPQQGLGTQPVQTAQGPSAAAGGSNGLRETPTIQGKGLYKFKADVRNAQLADSSRGQDVQREASAATTATARAQLAHTLGKENTVAVDKRTDDYARGKVAVPPPATGITGADAANRAKYDADVKAKSSEVKGLIAHSLSERKDGRTPESLSPAEHSQLLLANDLRERITDARGNLTQSVRDFFGNKRFDSRNLYSYMPTKAERANNGGYVVHFANGNTAHVTDVAGGGFRLVGPNTPVDADIMSLIKPHIDRARSGGQ